MISGMLSQRDLLSSNESALAVVEKILDRLKDSGIGGRRLRVRVMKIVAKEAKKVAEKVSEIRNEILEHLSSSKNTQLVSPDDLTRFVDEEDEELIPIILNELESNGLLSYRFEKMSRSVEVFIDLVDEKVS